ncbi:MAG: AlwI family type II restriction endonuclease, partial [Actinomycetes bacterium]
MTIVKSWNIGNTSVRNPERIRAGLRVFADGFAGGPWSEDVEEGFYRALVREGVYLPTGEVVAGTTAGQGGRKWASAFKQLGFATVGRRTGAGLTPIGELLLDPDADVSRIFLRQLLKQHLTSPIDRAGNGFDVYPLRLTLKVLARLRELGLGGPTKEEIGLYLVTATQSADEDRVVDRIVEHRRQRDLLKGAVAKARYDGTTRLRVAAEVYADELT